MNTAFTKMQACGNDFVVVDDREAGWLSQESVLAQRICQRHLGLGADGLLLLRNSSLPGHFGMVFINADGLIGEMCGNGARCLAAYIRRAGLASDTMLLQTGAGTVQVRFLDALQIELTLPPAGPLHPGQIICWANREWTFDALDVGPPHVVCLLDSPAELEALDVAGLGRAVRHHARFAPRGCNVNFAVVHQQQLLLRTYERGVEDETLGCGTGAVATALVARWHLGQNAPAVVLTRSGETLEIGLDRHDCMLTLTGGAHFVADGHLASELLFPLTPD